MGKHDHEIEIAKRVAYRVGHRDLANATSGHVSFVRLPSQSINSCLIAMQQVVYCVNSCGFPATRHRSCGARLLAWAMAADAAVKSSSHSSPYPLTAQESKIGRAPKTESNRYTETERHLRPQDTFSGL